MEAGSERPSGTVTFLFTDIEGSTRLLQRLGPAYAGALGDHQRLLREAFAAQDGHEIDTQGDSFFVAFRRAKDAVSAAVAGQRALAAHEWPDGVELRVRMGIHTGEPLAGEERYVGLGVHRAARIGAAAVGGQVLVSETTRSLLRDDPPPGVSLRDLGLRHLKDIDEPERLFELNAPGLISRDLPQSARRHSRRRMVVGVVLVTAAIAAALGTLFSRGGGGTAFAGTVQPNEVGVVNTKTGGIIGSVPVGSAPDGLAAGDSAVWVANTDANTVTRIDPGTEAPVQTVQVGSSPAGVAVSPDGVWVANGADGTVSWISPATNTVVKTIQVGNGPTGVAYTAGQVWVANSADGTVSEIDSATGKVTRTIPAVVGISELVVAAGHIWGVAPASGVAVELGAGGVARTVQVGVDPDAIAYAAGAIWVANRQDGTVSRIDPGTGSVPWTGQVGQQPDALAGSPDGIWVANENDGTLAEIDPLTNTVVKRRSLANPPQGLASSGHTLYVSVRSNGSANRGGTLRVDTGNGGPDSLDPAYAYSPTSWAVLPMTNDGLVGFRRVGGPAGVQLVPDLAEALPTPTDGGRSYTFTLRPGLRYSNGQPVEPEDVKAEIERVLAGSHPTPGTRGYYMTIRGASGCKPGKPCNLSAGIVTNRLLRTITFHLTAPDGDFLTKLAMPPAYAVPASTPLRQQSTVPATGPYKVAQYSTTQRQVRLVRNPRFRQWSPDAQPAGFPDRIDLTWPANPDSPRQVFSLSDRVKKGAEDVVFFPGSPPVPKQVLNQLALRYPSQLHLEVEPATWYFFLNTRVAPFDKPGVRRAVEAAFDHAAFGRLLTKEYSPTCDILPPGYPGYLRGCARGGTAASRLRAARALIRSSGQFGARVTVWTPGPLAFEGRYMIHLLDSLGLRARAHTVPPADIGRYFSTILNPHSRVQTGYIGWVADYPSSLAFFHQQFSCGTGAVGDVSRFCSPRIDAEINHAGQVQALDPPAAFLLWRKLDRELLALAPVVPTYNGRAVVFLSKRVRNFEYHPQWGALLDQLWVK